MRSRQRWSQSSSAAAALPNSARSGVSLPWGLLVFSAISDGTKS
nr:hypothetical protein [uncultured bacterium]